MKNFYINNTEILHRFILYFKDKSSDLIDNSREDNIIKTDLIFSDLLPENTKEVSTNEKFYKKTEPKNIFLNKNTYLTTRELECCSFLMRGDSIKIAGNKIGISPRTFETHINNVKKKTTCMTKNVLLDLLNKNEWIFKTILE